MKAEPQLRRTAKRDPARAEELRLLFGRLANGDLDALDEVWANAADDLYGLALWRLGSEADAEDAVQESFVRLVRAAPRLAEVRNPFGYLLRTVHRITLDMKRQRRTHQDLDTVTTVAFVEPEAENKAEASRLSSLLGRLSPDQREAVYLREILGMKLREVGAATGVSTFTAASRHRQGMSRLRRWLGVKS